jgi:hypothetical protein
MALRNRTNEFKKLRENHYNEAYSDSKYLLKNNLNNNDLENSIIINQIQNKNRKTNSRT